MTHDQQVMPSAGGMMNGIIIPMLLEDGEWKIDLPGWRFAYR
jgi:hypothetical protein